MIIHLERVAGIEPAYSDWQPDALPLCYTRTVGLSILFVVPRL